MEVSHRLKELLQLQLASDSYAVLHLPFVLETLTKEDFLPSAQTQKWIARVNSLIHSKDPAAKWSGLCLAHQTATFSRDIMLECAQSWVGTGMPLLVNQPTPTMNAAIRLLRLVFSSALDVSEFQRQLCIPNVPKFVNALIMIVEKGGNSESTFLVLDTLTHMVSLHPSLCRPLHESLSNIALRSLNGSAPNPTPNEHVEACSRLYAVLLLTGGKVNAPNLWRKSLDDTIAFAWGAFLQLRTTYPDRGYGIPRPNPPAEDPVIAIPLALDRLRAGMQVLRDLLCTNTSRPVSLPVGSLVRLCSALLQCSQDEKGEAHADHTVHALERSVVPTLWELACEILTSVSRAAQHHLTPHLPTLLSHLAYHLERAQTPPHTLRFLRTTWSLLAYGSHLHDSVIGSRLARAITPLLSAVLSRRSQAGGDDEQAAVQGRSKKGKKRARGYEGDEVFKVGREIVCPTVVEGGILLASVELLENLLYRAQVSPPVSSIGTRLLLSIYASLPQLPPAVLSPDLSLHPRLYTILQRACVNIAIGTTGTMSKSFGVVLSLSDGMLGEKGELLVPAEVDLLLHPRMPPLVRSLPHVETLSLFRAEEGEEESDTRKRIGLGVLEERSIGQSDVAESITPQETEQTRLSSASWLPLEVAKNTGAPPVQEQSTVALQVDVHPLAPAVATASRIPGPSMELQALQSSLPVHHPTIDRRVAQSPLPPPPPDPLPSSSAALRARSTASSIPPVTQVTPIPALTGEDDGDDEPMPTIDLGSDSDSD